MATWPYLLLLMHYFSVTFAQVWATDASID
jgi:hypothetical protein